MGNHFHLILAGQKEDCIKTFDLFAAKLKDSVFLTDEELYLVICTYINKKHSVKIPSQLRRMLHSPHREAFVGKIHDTP